MFRFWRKEEPVIKEDEHVLLEYVQSQDADDIRRLQRFYRLTDEQMLRLKRKAGVRESLFDDLPW